MWLRPVNPADAEWIWRLDQDPEVMQWISGGAPTPREEVLQVLLPRMLASHAAGPQYGFWAACLNGESAPLGWFHLKPGRLDPYEQELGYRLFRAHWGRGLATEGSRVLLRAAFGDWGLEAVAAHALVGNRRSRAVMERCGMKFVREWTVPADWMPTRTVEQRRAAYYRIDRETWRIRSGTPPEVRA